ncbi:MAG: FMN-binding protein [Dehalococcoidia bacterium]|nr:MAG: FMN-binding protein [Dehalococcoidia bacterium]
MSTPSPYRDGTFAGAGRGPHGTVDVEVVIAGGLIVGAQITECGTRYPCDRIAPLEEQVVELQDLLHVTRVTGATDSSSAYVRAVSDALVKASK